jgi:hypothetical protein
MEDGGENEPIATFLSTREGNDTVRKYAVMSLIIQCYRKLGVQDLAGSKQTATCFNGHAEDVDKTYFSCSTEKRITFFT